MTDRDNEISSTVNLIGVEEMARYGIARVPVDYFHYGKYRYSNLRDAIAQAERDGRGASSRGSGG
jgi:hypothetical protein